WLICLAAFLALRFSLRSPADMTRPQTPCSYRGDSLGHYCRVRAYLDRCSPLARSRQRRLVAYALLFCARPAAERTIVLAWRWADHTACCRRCPDLGID